MRIMLLSPGRAKGSFYEEATKTYLKRITPAIQLEEINIKGEKNPTRLTQLENEKILSLIPDGATVIALDPLGKQMTSPNFAHYLQQLKNQSTQQVCFIIGGAEGLSDAVKKRAHKLLSFGQATWPHLLARVMLLEQLYRAQQILNGHPYHKE